MHDLSHLSHIEHRRSAAANVNGIDSKSLCRVNALLLGFLSDRLRSKLYLFNKRL